MDAEKVLVDMQRGDSSEEASDLSVEHRAAGAGGAIHILEVDLAGPQLAILTDRSESTEKRAILNNLNWNKIIAGASAIAFWAVDRADDPILQPRKIIGEALVMVLRPATPRKVPDL